MTSRIAPSPADSREPHAPTHTTTTGSARKVRFSPDCDPVGGLPAITEDESKEATTSAPQSPESSSEPPESSSGPKKQNSRLNNRKLLKKQDSKLAAFFGVSGHHRKRFGTHMGRKSMRRIPILHEQDEAKEEARRRRHRLQRRYGKLVVDLMTTVVHPHWRIRRLWDLVTACLVIYLCVSVPLDLGFSHWYKPTGLKSFLVFIDVWFWCDIVLNFRTGFVEDGFVVLFPWRRIARHYVTTWLAIDVAGSFPFEAFVAGSSSTTSSSSYGSGSSTMGTSSADVTGAKNARTTVKMLKYLKLAKLLRVGRILKYHRAGCGRGSR